MSGQTEAGNDPQRMSWLDGGVGILVNPMSGRDVRRLAAHAANMTHEAKRDIVARIAAGADACGAGVLHVAKEPFRIATAAVEHMNLSARVNVIDGPVRNNAGAEAYEAVHNALMTMRAEVSDASLRALADKQGLDTEAIMYHAISVSRELPSRGMTIRAGVANLLDEEPPRLTTLSDGLGEVYTQGNSAFYSQYDWLGRRMYLNFTKTF